MIIIISEKYIKNERKNGKKTKKTIKIYCNIAILMRAKKKEKISKGNIRGRKIQFTNNIDKFKIKYSYKRVEVLCWKTDK